MISPVTSHSEVQDESHSRVQSAGVTCTLKKYVYMRLLHVCVCVCVCVYACLAADSDGSSSERVNREQQETIAKQLLRNAMQQLYSSQPQMFSVVNLHYITWQSSLPASFMPSDVIL